MTLSRIKKTVVILLFLLAVCFALLTPIRDNDFFWHLATGKWIAEHEELPSTDPFAYTTSQKAQEDYYRAKIILTQYWLANLLQYGIFSLAGFDGIIALRVLIILATLLVLSFHLQKKGLDVISTILLLLPLSFTLMAYAGDRPNQMTFMFVAIFMFLTDAMKRGEKKGYLLTPIFVLWANMHGGFLLGAVIAVIVLVSEIIKKMFMRDYVLDKRFLTVMALTLGAGFLNPNGYAVVYSTLFETSTQYNAYVSETQAPFAYMKVSGYSHLLRLGILLLFALLYFMSRIFSGSLRPKEGILRLSDELLLVIFLAGISFTAIRYIPLFAIVAVPITAPLFSGKFQVMLQKLSRYLVPELLIIAVSIGWIFSSYPHTVMNRPTVGLYFPRAAVQFIKQNDIKGHFFNYYDWGGYLIWQFYPEKSVFIDGRGISLDVFKDYDDILSGRPEKFMGISKYKAMFEAYSVRHIIVPAIDMSGDILKILKDLEKDPEWHLIFVGYSSLIYSRDAAQPEYPKTLSYEVALSNVQNLMYQASDNPFPYLTFAKANSSLGRHQAALDGLEEALRRRPSLRGGPVEKALSLLKEGKEIPIDMKQ